MDAPYFSVCELSIEDERVPCTTKIAFAGLGSLDPSSQSEISEDLQEDSKVCFEIFQFCVMLVS